MDVSGESLILMHFIYGKTSNLLLVRLIFSYKTAAS